MTGWREESYNFYLGGPPKLSKTDPIVKELDKRNMITSISSGNIVVHCEIVMRAFRDQSLTGDK